MGNLNFNLNFETVNNTVNANEKTFIGSNDFTKFQALEGNLKPYNSQQDKPLRKKLQSLRATQINTETELLKVVKNLSLYSYIKVSNGYLLNSGEKANNKYIYIFISDNLIKELKQEVKTEEVKTEEVKNKKDLKQLIK